MSESATLVNERDQWLEGRRKYLGGTDVAAIIGENQFKSPLAVWLDKKGLGEDVDNPRMRYGREREAFIADRYVEITGAKIEDCGLFVHPTVEFFGANPDRLLVEHPGVLECKSGINRHRASYGWGEPGTDQVPRIYLIQGVWYAGILNREFCDFAFEDRETCETNVYRVWRDMEYEALLFEVAEKWWRTHVLGDVEPVADERDLDALKAKLPTDAGTIVAATQPIEEACIVHAKEKAVANLHYGKSKDAEALVKQFMGDAAVLTLSDGRKVTWKNNASSVETNWELVARKVAEQVHLEDHDLAKLISDFTTTKPGSRVFRGLKEA